MAAPGTPKAWVTPSRCRICTAAWMAFIRGMAGSWEVRWRSAAARELLDQLEEGRVVEAPVALGLEAGHQLGHGGAQRDDHPGLAGGRGDDPEVLVVQLDAEPGGEVAGQHGRRLALEDGVA